MDPLNAKLTVAGLVIGAIGTIAGVVGSWVVFRERQGPRRQFIPQRVVWVLSVAVVLTFYVTAWASGGLQEALHAGGLDNLPGVAWLTVLLLVTWWLYFTFVAMLVKLGLNAGRWILAFMTRPE